MENQAAFEDELSQQVENITFHQMISFEYTYRSSTYKVEGVPLIANGQLTFTGEIMLSNMGEDTFDMDLGTRSLWSDLLNFTVNLSDGNFDWPEGGFSFDYFLAWCYNTEDEISKQRETFERAFLTNVVRPLND